MNKKGKLDFWDLLLYGSAITIIVWALLKAFRIVESPIWFEMLPYLAVGIAIFSGVYKFGGMMRNIKNIDGRVSKTDEKVNRLLEMRDDFIKVKHNQFLCMNGKLKHNPFRKGF